MYKLIPETGVGGQGKFRGRDRRLKVKSTLTLALSRREKGLNWGMLKKYADLKVLYRIHNRRGLSVDGSPRSTLPLTLALSRRERGLNGGCSRSTPT
jgi:hypothetical protein